MAKLYGLAGVLAFVGILALMLWVPGKNWSYLLRARTKREIIVWTVLMVLLIILIVGGALLHI
jgi:hypothetical protein